MKMSSTNSSNNTFVTIERISDGALRVWSQLPETIKSDPSLAAFYDKFSRDNVSRTGNFANNSSQEHHYISNNENIHNRCNNANDQSSLCKQKLQLAYKYTKILLLVGCWILFFLILATTKEKEEVVHQVLVPGNEIKHLILTNETHAQSISITVESPLLLVKNQNDTPSSYNYYLSVWLEFREHESRSPNNQTQIKIVSGTWLLPLLPPELIDSLPNKKLTKVFEPSDVITNVSKNHFVILNLKTNFASTASFTVSSDLFPLNVEDGMVYGAVLLVGLYVLIVFEVVHSTIAAMIASTTSLAVLAALNQRPTMAEIISWIDIDTLLLLFSMMILVTIIADTGILDYLAVYAYKLSKGKVWTLISLLCFFTAFFSAFLDNVTMILLITPVTIRLCEVMQLRPVPILMAMVIFSNIGGAMTPVGDPPNVIIASNEDIVDAGIHFGTFTAHMSIGVVLALIAVYGHFCFVFRDINALHIDKTQDTQKLEREINLWQENAAALANQNEDENLIKEILEKKIDCLLAELKKKRCSDEINSTSFETNLKELQEKYPIKNKLLLVKSGFTICLAILLFFLHSLPELNLSLGWIAFLSVLLLLILADHADFEKVIGRVEWGTLLFFAALFIFMEVLTKLGIISYIGRQTEIIIMSAGEESRLAVAILLLVWVSAIFGALFDNVPLTTMMVRIVIGLGQNRELGLPIQPLVWAMAAGMCMGGNGTLIGATANVVCAGVAEQYGYKISFKDFFKLGFPVMLTSTLTITIYLMIAHVAFSWH